MRGVKNRFPGQVGKNVDGPEEFRRKKSFRDRFFSVRMIVRMGEAFSEPLTKKRGETGAARASRGKNRRASGYCPLGPVFRSFLCSQ